MGIINFQGAKIRSVTPKNTIRKIIGIFCRSLSQISLKFVLGLNKK